MNTVFLEHFDVSPHPESSAFVCRQALQFEDDSHRALYAMGSHNNKLRAIYYKLKSAVQSFSWAYDKVSRGMQALIWMHVQQPADVIALQQNIQNHYETYKPLPVVDLVADQHEPPFKNIWQQQALLNDPLQVKNILEFLENQNQLFSLTIMDQQTFINSSIAVLSRGYTTSTLQWLLTQAGATAATISSAQTMMNDYWQYVYDLCLRTGLDFAATQITELIQQHATTVDQAGIALCGVGGATAAETAGHMVLWKHRLYAAQQKQLVVRSTRAIVTVTALTATAGYASRPDATNPVISEDTTSSERADVSAADKAVPLLLQLPVIAAAPDRTADVSPPVGAPVLMNPTATVVEELAADEEDLPSEDALAADQYDAVVTLVLPAIPSRAHKPQADGAAESFCCSTAVTAGCPLDDADHSVCDFCGTASSSSNSSSNSCCSEKLSARPRVGRLLRGVVNVVRGVVVSVAVVTVVKGVVRAGSWVRLSKQKHVA